MYCCPPHHGQGNIELAKVSMGRWIVRLMSGSQLFSCHAWRSAFSSGYGATSTNDNRKSAPPSRPALLSCVLGLPHALEKIATRTGIRVALFATKRHSNSCKSIVDWRLVVQRRKRGSARWGTCRASVSARVALCVGSSTPSVSFTWGKLGIVSRIALGSTMRH